MSDGGSGGSTSSYSPDPPLHGHSLARGSTTKAVSTSLRTLGDTVFSETAAWNWTALFSPFHLSTDVLLSRVT